MSFIKKCFEILSFKTNQNWLQIFSDKLTVELTYSPMAEETWEVLNP